MKTPPAHALIATVLLACLGCGRGEGPNPNDIDNLPQWQITFRFDDKLRTLRPARLNVYITDAPSGRELLEIKADGLLLVGALPPDRRVGREENWKKLIGHPIAIRPRNDRTQVAAGPSHLTLDGEKWTVTAGSIFFDKHHGGHGGLKGDLTLEGRFELRLKNSDRPQAVNGRISVQCVLWE